MLARSVKTDDFGAELHGCVINTSKHVLFVVSFNCLGSEVASSLSTIIMCLQFSKVCLFIKGVDPLL